MSVFNLKKKKKEMFVNKKSDIIMNYISNKIKFLFASYPLSLENIKFLNKLDKSDDELILTITIDTFIKFGYKGIYVNRDENFNSKKFINNYDTDINNYLMNIFDNLENWYNGLPKSQIIKY